MSFEKTLKPLAIEEFLDYYFYRRIAHLFVPYFVRFKVTPDQITSISLLFGLASCYFVFHQQFIPSVLMAMMAIFMDCCDGQVARLTGKSSPLGRIMDGFFDMVWIVLFWHMLYFSGYFKSYHLPNVVFLMMASGASMVIHCWRFDGVKIKYLELVDPKSSEGDMDFDSAVALMKDKFKKFQFFSAFLAFCIAFQVYFFVRGNEGKKVYSYTPIERQNFQTQLEPIINHWSYLGEGHHNTIVLLGALLAPISPYGLLAAFWFILVPMNLWWLFCEKSWSHKFNQIVKMS